MGCFKIYYYEIKNCTTDVISWTDHDDLRLYDIGCVFIDQLTGNCYELLSVSIVVPGSLVNIQTTPCHVYNTCTECLAVTEKLGCVDKAACNYDPCATRNDGSIVCDTSIAVTMSTNTCIGEPSDCSEPDCT